MAFTRLHSSTVLFSHLLTFSPLLHPPLLPFSSLSLSRLANRRAPVSASVVAMDQNPTEEIEAPTTTRRKWKPLCLYYTQGKCTMMEDGSHLEKFNHNLALDLGVDGFVLNKLRPQELDYLLVLDLEGKVEILEFPVVMIDTRNMKFVDSFHRFVRPTMMSEQKITQYIEGKYGKFGVDGVWHDTAIPFKDVLQEFEQWLAHHNLWEKVNGGPLNRAAFVTCGNWDLKTKVPDQCRVSKIKLPPYFMEWINLKDIFLNFYNRRATGMVTMMRELQMPLFGSHHLGIDDAKNIVRVLQHMLSDGALMQITARRGSSESGDVKFTFKNRI
ncbi:Polynucleotidyl transferase ribonuclease H-like superfamily protein [Rhynchospora pubera]|uniref:Polynucleotidyl transferase ribonuclease H-like superfamily protein n=1 Tax=Rhynchospora pubera TaxID=906938 RepID=A0AAV8FEQ7_9POAL|nr:Polynucleotidyl transferase ribonuclease H-like superfamily protein [Rhynchospora pubera]